MSDLLTVAEAASELGVSKRTVIRRINAGKLQAEMPGTEWLIPRSAIEDHEDDDRQGREPVPA